MKSFYAWIVATLCLTASTADAVEMRVGWTRSGDLTTIELSLSNPDQAFVTGLEVDLLLPSDATVLSGEAASIYFVQSCLPTECIGGIRSVANAFYDYRDLTVGYWPGDELVEVVRAVSISGSPATGALDPGLDGSAVDVRITLFDLRGPVYIQGRYADGVNVLPIRLVGSLPTAPEPGTALLLGLGLAGLASTRRRH